MGHAGDGSGGIEVVTRDELRPEHPAHVEQAAQRHHLIGLIGDGKLADILQLPAMIGLGLHADLEALVELVEQVDVSRSLNKLCKRLGDVVDVDTEGFGHGSVNIEVELRAAGAEGSKT